MSNFKVLPAGPPAHEQRDALLPRPPLLLLPAQTTLLTYPLERLLQQVQAFFEEAPLDRPALLSALKVLGCSLNDGKLMAGLEKALAAGTDGQVYALLALWAGQRFPLAHFLLKLTAAARKRLVLLVFEQFLTGSHCREWGVQQQLGALLSLTSPAELLPALQSSYDRSNRPLKTAVRKCRSVRSEHSGLRQLLAAFAASCLVGSAERLMEFSLEQEREDVEYLLEVVPSAVPALTAQLKQTVSAESLSRLASSSGKLNAVLQSAAREWLNEENNYWRVVQRGFTPAFDSQARAVLDYGRMVAKDTLPSECLTVQLLYSYLEGSRFDFRSGDAMVAELERENWIEVYRAIGQCSSHRLGNLIVINKSLAPSWWPTADPRAPCKALRRLVEKHGDFLREREEELAGGNKKMELAFSVLIVADRQTGREHALTFQQAEKWLAGGEDPSSYRDEYPPFRAEVKAKEEARKEHNVVIEAKLVRLLKRAKQSLPLQALASELGYSNEIVELGIKRLLSKSLAEEDGKGSYLYLA